MSTIKNPAKGNKNLNIYQFAAPAVTERSVLQIAKKFMPKAGIKEGRLSVQNDSISYQEGAYVVKAFRASGGYKFINTLMRQTDDGKSNLTIKDAAAIKIANTFIKQYKIASPKEYKILKLARTRIGLVELKTGESKERVVAVDVAFQRVIDGTPVDGPGGKLIVSINQDSKVAGCDITWRKIQKKLRKAGDLISEQTAISQAYKYWPALPKTTVVEKVRFGYFEESFDNPQKYLQPAHIIFLKIASPDLRFVRKTVYVAPAAVKHAGRIMPERKKTVKQIARRAGK